jgi:non-ribosomal peptide synthetase component F
MAEAETYWSRLLAEFTAPTVVKTNVLTTRTPRPDYHETALELPPELKKQIHAVVRGRRLTVGALLEGVWSLILSYFSGSRDVVYGVVTSSRPAEMADIEQAVGMFINTLPLRVKIEPHVPAVDLFSSIQDQQSQSRQYGYCSIARIQQWSQIPQGTRLFESIFLFQNYPTGIVDKHLSSGVKIEEIKHTVCDDAPLVLSIGQQLVLHLQVDKNRISTTTSEVMFAGCERILQEITRDPEVTIQKLLDLVGMVEKQVTAAGFQRAEHAAKERLRRWKQVETESKCRDATTPGPIKAHD